LRGHRTQVVDHRHARVQHQRTRQSAPHRIGAPARERAHVLHRVDRRRAELTAELGEHALGRARPKRDAPQSLVELREALEHEPRSRAGSVPAPQQPIVEAEDRHDLVARVERRAQSGVVVRPQVASEPDEADHSG
jgi:hypothetical protein